MLSCVGLPAAVESPNHFRRLLSLPQAYSSVIALANQAMKAVLHSDHIYMDQRPPTWGRLAAKADAAALAGSCADSGEFDRSRPDGSFREQPGAQNNQAITTSAPSLTNGRRFCTKSIAENLELTFDLRKPRFSTIRGSVYDSQFGISRMNKFQPSRVS